MADLITADDIKTLTGRIDGDALISQRFTAAINALNQLLCNAIMPQTTGSVSGIVGADGRLVDVSAWFSEITSVDTPDGRSVGYSFVPPVCDLTVSGTYGERYGRQLTLDSELSTGTVVTVSGTYGFTVLPDSLKTLLAATLGAFADHADKTDAVQSKSVEDVSVSYVAPDVSKILDSVLTVQQANADKWSLCGDKYRMGELSFPKTLPNPPYWVSGAELFGGERAYGNVR